MSHPTLTIIPTPIGNLEDITLRALRLLREATLILAEDTRTTAKLLNAYEIKTPLRSYHMHNEHAQAQRIVEQVMAGESVVLVSDAGTPGISDPGFLLVRECVAQGVEVTTLPGPTALIPAIVSSGLPCDRFCFEGFLPHKKGRLQRLHPLLEREMSTIFYESPNRLVKLLEQLLEVVGPEREAVVVREVSKKHETYHRGTVAELLSTFQAQDVLGEIVVVVAPAPQVIKQHTNKYQPSNE